MEGFGSGGMSTTSSAISTARQGRPSARSKQVVGNQPDLHGWFGQHAAVRSESSDGSHLGKPNSILALLCWGLRRKTMEYGGKWYRVNALLDDPKPGAFWTAEPTTSATFSCADKEVVVTGCFRHSACKWVSGCGEPFANFTCDACSKIVQENDFRLRVMKEGRPLVKRGSRDTSSGRRIDYLSIRELAGNSRRLATKYREERALHWQMKSKVAQLKMTQQGLKLSTVENFNRKDVLSFCNNILTAHRTNAFGAKPVLWDFLRDVAANLNRVRAGSQIFKKYKVLCGSHEDLWRQTYVRSFCIELCWSILLKY